MLQFLLIGLIILFSQGVLHSAPGILVFLFGLSVGIWALQHNRRGNFNIQPVLKEGCDLIMTGPYRYMRHPMYTSVIFMMLGIVISTPAALEWFFFFSLLLILTLKAKREEKLWCGHDVNYHEYQKHTKLFIPYIL